MDDGKIATLYVFRKCCSVHGRLKLPVRVFKAHADSDGYFLNENTCELFVPFGRRLTVYMCHGQAWPRDRI